MAGIATASELVDDRRDGVLEEWARAEVKGEPRRCRKCQPRTRRSPSRTPLAGPEAGGR